MGASPWKDLAEAQYGAELAYRTKVDLGAAVFEGVGSGEGDPWQQRSSRAASGAFSSPSKLCCCRADN